MARSMTGKAAGVEHGKPQLDDIPGALGNSNPFVADRVNEPSRYDVDVPGIHAKGFDRLVSLAGQAKKDGRGWASSCWEGRGSVRATCSPASTAGPSKRSSRTVRGPATSSCTTSSPIPSDSPATCSSASSASSPKGGDVPLDKTPLFRLVREAVCHALKRGKGGGDPVSLNEAADAYRAAFAQMPGSRDVYDDALPVLQVCVPAEIARPTYKGWRRRPWPGSRARRSTRMRRRGWD